LEIQGPITRRKEYQIMQISINKIQDANNPQNSLLKKFDDFYKDNKNIENEMYLYRNPRVNKVVFQAEVKSEENSKAKKKKKVAPNFSQFFSNSENQLKENKNGKGNQNYFDNETDNADNLKVIRII
jgi:hypothetical protein